MKKYIFLLLASFSIIGFFSCEEVDDPHYRGVAIHVSDLEFYSLDAGVSGEIIVSDNSVTQVVTDPANLGPVTLTAGKGTYNYTKADLGIDTVGAVLEVNFLVEGPEGPASFDYTYEIMNPLSISGPIYMVPEDVVYKFPYLVDEDCTPATGISISLTINGTPQDITGAYAIAKDTIIFNGSDYTLNDTLMIEITVTNANGVAKVQHEVLVIEPPYSFDYWGWYEEEEGAYGDVSDVYIWGDPTTPYDLTIYGFWAGELYEEMDVTKPEEANVKITIVLDEEGGITVPKQETGWEGSGVYVEGIGVYDEVTKVITLTLDFSDVDGVVKHQDIDVVYTPTAGPSKSTKTNKR